MNTPLTSNIKNAEIIGVFSKALYCECDGKVFVFHDKKWGYVPFGIAKDNIEDFVKSGDFKVGDTIEIPIFESEESRILPLFPPKKERLCSMESLILENGSASGLIESYNTYKSVKMNVDNLFSSLLSGTSSPEYAVKLIGLGRGLTPSGDDFLAGMFSLFFAAEKCGIKVPAALCDYALAVRENIGRTSKISGAYLLSVLDKKRFSLYENACLALLGEGDAASFANEVLPLGASSGTDTLCGALFAAKVIERI